MSDPIEIPVFADTPLYRFRVTLDGQDYIFRFDWNARADRWYLDIGTINEEWIVRGIKLIADWPLLRRVSDSRRPPGNLMAIDLSPLNGEPPVLSDFGMRVKLIYIPAT